MKRSRSGTASRDNGPRTATIILMVALATVLAFAGSFVFGLKRSTEVAPVEDVAQPRQPAVTGDKRGRVEVLNGAGRSGLARDATDQLRDAGFDVVQFGNAGRIEAKSHVLDRVGNLDLAKEIAASLGIADIRTEIDSTRYVDASVILGSDWPPRKPQEP